MVKLNETRIGPGIFQSVARYEEGLRGANVLGGAGKFVGGWMPQDSSSYSASNSSSLIPRLQEPGMLKMFGNNPMSGSQEILNNYKTSMGNLLPNAGGQAAGFGGALFASGGMAMPDFVGQFNSTMNSILSQPPPSFKLQELKPSPPPKSPFTISFGEEGSTPPADKAKDADEEAIKQGLNRMDYNGEDQTKILETIREASDGDKDKFNSMLETLPGKAVGDKWKERLAKWYAENVGKLSADKVTTFVSGAKSRLAELGNDVSDLIETLKNEITKL